MEIKISNKFELGKFMTFEFSKDKPVYGWFWYKEGYAPEMVDFALKNEKITPNEETVLLDPFCGTGTSLLAAKQSKMPSIGVDASSLAAFISRTKTADYSKEDIEAAKAFLAKKIEVRDEKGNWDFELFPARAAFPKRNYNEILALRSAIENEEGPARDLMLLALISILPQASIILKDGGVLKIKKDKRAMPAKEIFRRKLKAIISDLENKYEYGFVPSVYVGDARALDIPSESVSLVVTSPPYLNNIDYSKVYGLELSLLEMSKSAASSMRMRAIRSYIAKDMGVEEMPAEVGEIGYKIPIIGTYFKDMEGSLLEMFRVLKTGGVAHVNVSNSVIHETHVLVDQVFAEMAQRIGFSDVEIVVGSERIADVRPAKVKTRESIVIMRK